MQPSTIELNNPHPPQLTIPNLSLFSLHTAARNALREQIVVLPLPAVLGPGAFVLNAQLAGDQQVNVASGTFRGIANRTKKMRDPLMQMLQAAAASGTLAGAPPPFSIRNVHGLAYSFVPQGAYDISFKPGSFPPSPAGPSPVVEGKTAAGAAPTGEEALAAAAAAAFETSS